MSEQNKALEMIAACYEDQEIEVNGRSYLLTKTNHRKRLKVFSYYTKVMNQMQGGDMSFFGTDEFEAIEKLMNEVLTYDGMQLSKLPKHWENEEYIDDYIVLMTTSMAVISYPFLKGSVGS